MLIGHLPAGYLLARRALRSAPAEARTTAVWAAALAGSVLPDLDLFYFYLIDGRARLHHEYWTHTPLFWAVVSSGLLFASRALARRRLALRLFCAGTMLHMVLDTWTGNIRWLYPLSDRVFRLVAPPARFDWWVWSFVFHWSFLAELALLAAAALAWRRETGA